MITRKKVFEAINSEASYQDKKWGTERPNYHDSNHSWEEWIMYMEDYLSEAKHLLSRNAVADVNTKVSDIMRKVVTMGVRALEHKGVNNRDAN